MRNLACALLLYLSIILQTTLMSHFQILHVQPDLVFAVLFCIAIAQGLVPSVIMGFLAGYALDILSARVGHYAIPYAVLPALICLAAALIRFDRLLLPSATAFACFLLKEIYSMGVLFFQNVDFNFSAALGRVLVGGALTLLLMLPLYQIAHSIRRARVPGGNDPLLGR